MDLFKIYSHLPVALQNALCTAKGIQLDRQRYRGGIALIISNLQRVSTLPSNRYWPIRKPISRA